jgi:hypothetical protein
MADHRQQLLSELAEVEADLGHADNLRELILELKALPPSPGLTGRIRFLELWFIRSGGSASHREDAFRRELEACGPRRDCVSNWSTWLGWELVDQGRPAEAKLLAQADPAGDLQVQVDLYAQVMTDLGKAAEAYPRVQAKMRDDLRMRGGVVNYEAWYGNRALATCLLAMHELDEAARVIASMAPFHRAWEDVEGRGMGLSMEAELALARRAVPPELPGLIRAHLGEPGMSFFPRQRDELRMELGRLLLATGKAREGRTVLAQANREATLRGELRTARLARAAIEEQPTPRRLGR